MSEIRVANYVDGTVEIVAVPEYDDTSRTVTLPDGTTRPYTEQENAAADAQIAQSALLTDLTERIARLEAALWPAQPDPEDPEDPSIREWADWNGAWPPDTLLRDGGKVWRNKTSVPLTTRPTEFPGDTSKWEHLFVEVTLSTTEPDPDPEPDPEPTVPPWETGGTYKADDLRTFGSIVYRCIQPHTNYDPGHTPNLTPSLWTPQG